MKYFLLVVCLIGMMAAGAYAQVGQTWATDFNGTTAATINNRFDQDGTAGWHWGQDNLEIAANDHAYDATKGIPSATAGDGGALKLLDDDWTGGYKSSHLAYDVGERSDASGTLIKWGGVVVSRVQYNATAYAGVGFGYATSDGNHTGILGLKENAVSMSGWLVNAGPTEYPESVAAVPGGNVGKYRTLALGWHVLLSPPAGRGGTGYDVWVLNEGVGNWSNNPADWTQIVTNIAPRVDGTNNNDAPDNAAIDGMATGMQIGSWGPGWGGYGRTASGDVDFDWIAMTHNTQGGVPNIIAPWQVDYEGAGIPLPEPATLALLGVGFCAALLRRRVR